MKETRPMTFRFVISHRQMLPVGFLSVSYCSSTESSSCYVSLSKEYTQPTPSSWPAIMPLSGAGICADPLGGFYTPVLARAAQK